MSGTYPVGTRVIVHGHVIGVRGNDGAVDYRVSTYDNPEGTWFSWVVVDDHTEPAHTIDELRKDVLELRTDLAEEHERAERLAAYAFCADTLRRCPAGGPSQALWSRRYEHAKAALQPGDLGETGETK